MSDRRLFIFGLGYTTVRLATELLAGGWKVAGSCRSAEKRRRLAALGIEVVPFDRDGPIDSSMPGFAAATHLVSSVPPDGQGDPVLDRHRADLAGHGTLSWVGYLSSTGVYGDRGGAWVDESSERKPSGERGQRRAAAEAGWLALHHEHGVPVHAFRLAGIYGPDRSALDVLRRGTARRIVKPGHAFSRIHVDDIVGVLRASMTRSRPGAVYNVCDDVPSSAAEVTAYGAELLGIPAPPEEAFEDAALSPGMRGFYADNRRVSNRRIKDELGYALAYPSYREGLTAILGR